jgi:hypothetical protein
MSDPDYLQAMGVWTEPTGRGSETREIGPDNGPNGHGLAYPNVWVPKMPSSHDANLYSWMTPPIRSRRWTRTVSRSVTAAGSDLRGAA